MNQGAAAAAKVKAKAEKEKKKKEAEKKKAEAAGQNVVGLFFYIGPVEVFIYHSFFFFLLQTAPAVDNNNTMTATSDSALGANKTSADSGKVGSDEQGQVKVEGQQYVRRRALAGTLFARMVAGI